MLIPSLWSTLTSLVSRELFISCPSIERTVNKANGLIMISFKFGIIHVKCNVEPQHILLFIHLKFIVELAHTLLFSKIYLSLSFNMSVFLILRTICLMFRHDGVLDMPTSVAWTCRWPRSMTVKPSLVLA